ncbi:hypothetical protein JHL18_19285 [Clostridium sp. YIM B02505]|uniref:Lipoprotein n=1 Tax=Clostridium yunnanense TaxID=2800325 RepID=A0ABS1ETQ2_9CLOT|nr:hypothetical protein [Clostridium yunnanense]MBK1812769.1 hypothetical protein [Clostridium yunnanense]
MKRQSILISLCVVMMLSFVGCTNSTKKDTKEDAKVTTVTNKDDSKSKSNDTEKSTSDNSTSTNSSSNTSTSSTGNSGFTVIKESEYTDLKYENGKYKEVDEALSIVKDYYLKGINAVSNKLVSMEYDDSKEDADKWFAVPLTDKEKTQLDLNYQSMKNQIKDNIQDISVDSYTWEKAVGGNPKYAIDITFKLVIKTDKGDSYSTSCYVSALNKDGNIKLQIQ